MTIQQYGRLTEEAKRIREDVFVKEQGFCEEFDAIDEVAVHLVLFADGEAAATCRYFWSEDRSSNVVGRIAVVKMLRGKNLGALILQEAERLISAAGGGRVGLSAQASAQGFYQKQGYQRMGEPYFEEQCAHIWMEKLL